MTLDYQIGLGPFLTNVIRIRNGEIKVHLSKSIVGRPRAENNDI